MREAAAGRSMRATLVLMATAMSFARPSIAQTTLPRPSSESAQVRPRTEADSLRAAQVAAWRRAADSLIGDRARVRPVFFAQVGKPSQGCFDPTDVVVPVASARGWPDSTTARFAMFPDRRGRILAAQESPTITPATK